MRSWWVDSDTRAEGSAEKAMDGRHYYRSVRLHKQSFEVLLRYGLQNLITMSDLGKQVKTYMAEMMTRPSAATLAALIDHSDFLNIFQQLLSST